eukprot:6727509-Ditylum_brightwellii.AAC.1
MLPQCSNAFQKMLCNSSCKLLNHPYLHTNWIIVVITYKQSLRIRNQVLISKWMHSLFSS